MKKIKTKIAQIAFIATLMISIFVTINPTAQAQELEPQPSGGQPLPAGVTPDQIRSTEAFMSIRPNPVGLNQIFLVNIWTQPSLHASRYHRDYTVTITKPSGEQQVVTMDSYYADATAWFEWIADEIGEWKFKFEFPGNYFPAGIYQSGYGRAIDETAIDTSVYYEPSSTQEQTLIVQEEIVYSWPESPLPTEYWTRPIPPEHREWWQIAGNFPWFGPAAPGDLWDEIYPNTNPYRMGMAREPMQRFAAWAQAPDSAHVVWKRDSKIAGIIGGDIGAQTLEGSAGHPSIILFGRAYQGVEKVDENSPTSQTYWQCYDIRTGEIFWERPLYDGEMVPDLIEYGFGDLEVPGAEAKPSTPSIMSIGGGYLRKYDPSTGIMTLNVSVSPLADDPRGYRRYMGKYYMNGYALEVQNMGGGQYRLINWTTHGTTKDLSARVVSNVTWPWNNLGYVQEFNVGIAANLDRPRDVSGAYQNTSITAANMYTGEVLWTTEVAEVFTSSGGILADHGKIAVSFVGTRTWMCWNLHTGQFEWESEKAAYPWGAFWSYSSDSAYGMIYCGTYESFYAIDWDDGSIAWKFTAPALYAYETPRIDENGETVYPWFSSLYIADGKVFTYNNIHTPEQPIKRGWKFFALNASTGEEIWSLPGWGIAARNFEGAMADGYLAVDSGFLGTMFVIGQGESETTVNASPKVVESGSTVMIEGTMLDTSPAQAGTPCVSKESMGTMMAHLHMQWPIDGFRGDEVITGVPVILTAIAEDGTYIDIGSVTTDGYSGTFGKEWTPPNEGTFKIIASFEADESYGSSSATTWITVGPAASAGGTITPEEPTPEQPTPEQPTPEEPTPEGSTPEEPTPEQPESETTAETPLISTELAIVIAIAAACIIGAVAYIALRRRK